MVPGARFDAYSATTKAIPVERLVDLAAAHRSTPEGPIDRKAYHGFERRLAFRDRDGSENISVLWGGMHGDRAMIEVKGDKTPDLVRAFRAEAPMHNCTRVDSCADFNGPGTWDRLLGEAMAVKVRYGLRGERRGDWDYPEDGRTQYLGAAASISRVRVYEKGKEPHMSHLGLPDLVRAELQVRPKQDARRSYSTLDADQVWGASPFTRDLAKRILELDVRPAPAGTVYRLSERDQALRWMIRQYGKHLQSLAEDCGGYDCMGLTLREMITAEAAERASVNVRKSRRGRSS